MRRWPSASAFTRFLGNGLSVDSCVLSMIEPQLNGTSVAGFATGFSRGGSQSRPFPLGVSAGVEGRGVNVAVFAPAHTGLTVHFRTSGGQWSSVPLTDFTDGIHHGLVPGLEAGCLYGLWPQGYPLRGSLSESQLLLDPYGRAIETVRTESSTNYWSAVVEPDFDWGASSRPDIPLRDTVVYETHVKGLTIAHPDIPEELRGTYAGLAHPVMIEHLTALGVTAVELLPVHFHLDELHLRELGLTNYWGYNTLGYFALQPDYATEAARRAGPKAVQDEFKGMVRLLHEAGLEVILDVVYNHTAEGGADQPALSWRGLGEREYYRHNSDGSYQDTTGCGNTLDFSQPWVVQFALDSLRYWVGEFQIDGFRFDLAVALARDTDNSFNSRHAFLVAARADPALSGVKLFAEPWDVGPDGWQTGRFPVGWADWNDKFRDTVKDFWLADAASMHDGGGAGSVAHIAGCLAGSGDVFAPSGRSPLASLNYVTAHDGFTLADLTAYNEKHNEANGEHNRDGHSDNRSWNHGTEGVTDDASILQTRDQTARNLMATLLLSLGIPMISAGDELGRSQQGNNNAYCQDNEVTWVDWTRNDRQRKMFHTTRSLLKIRREFLAHQPYSYPARGESSYLLWFNADGQPMTQEQWGSDRVVQLLLGSPDGILDGLIVINGSLRDIDVVLPPPSALREFGLSEDDVLLFDRRFSTAAHDSRRGTVTAGGHCDHVGANTVTVYRGRG